MAESNRGRPTFKAAFPQKTCIVVGMFLAGAKTLGAARGRGETVHDTFLAFSLYFPPWTDSSQR
jgi:hypothetical protein